MFTGGKASPYSLIAFCVSRHCFLQTRLSPRLGDAFLREQLTIVELHAGALQVEGNPRAVHETRKAIRRMQVVFTLLAPYFEEGLFDRYRRQFRRTARRLGPARDTYVFLDKLTMLLEETGPADTSREEMESLQEYWRAQLEQAVGQAQRATQKRGYRKALAAFRKLVDDEGTGVAEQGMRIRPIKVRHLAPTMIMDQLSRVLAYDDYVQEASAAQFHTLPIRFKWLRYTLDFLTPVLGNEVLTLTGELNEIQDHLGDFQAHKSLWRCCIGPHRAMGEMEALLLTVG